MASKVVAVTELLESILVELPMKDLLFAQKICKHWKAVIDTSDKLQKALFLKPGTATDAPPDAFGFSNESGRVSKVGGSIVVNPLLCPYLVCYHEQRVKDKVQNRPSQGELRPCGF